MTYRGIAPQYDATDDLTSFGGLFMAGYGIGGERTWKGSGDSRTYYLYAGGVPICEMDSDGNVTATNTFGVNGLLNRHDDSGTAFYTFDPQGSVVQQLSSTGTVTSSVMYDAYGSRLTTTPVSPFGYGGQSGYYTDPETGLLLLTYRYYDPQEGRFLTRDPIGYAGGINLYAYCGNQPVNRYDPSGLDFETGQDDDDAWVGLNGFAATTGPMGYLRAYAGGFSEEGNTYWNCRYHQIGLDDYASHSAIGTAGLKYGAITTAGMVADLWGVGGLAGAILELPAALRNLRQLLAYLLTDEAGALGRMGLTATREGTQLAFTFTPHALKRMASRAVSTGRVAEIIETGRKVSYVQDGADHIGYWVSTNGGRRTFVATSGGRIITVIVDATKNYIESIFGRIF